MRKGLADIKLVFLGALPILLGGFLGSLAAITLFDYFGATGDALVRLTLGFIIGLIAITFIVGGASTEYPEHSEKSRLATRLKLRHMYWEETLKRPVRYDVHNVKTAVFLLLFVGFTGGFFGLGGGWAAVPLLNLVMSIPIKVATGTSGVLLALGNAAAIWPYINVGALIGIIAAPWMLGQVIGGLIGASLLTSLRASAVRALLIVILFASSVKLVARGIETLTGIEIPVL